MAFQLGDIVQINSPSVRDFNGLIGEIVTNTSVLAHSPDYYMVDLGRCVGAYPSRTLWNRRHLRLVSSGVDNIPEEW